jgi:hypothetical protein
VGDWLPFRVLTWSQIATMAPRIRRLAAYARRAVNGQATQVDLAFALVSHHPWLTRDQLRDLLAVDSARAGQLLREMQERRWARRVSAGELQRTDIAPKLMSRLDLVELTSSCCQAVLQHDSTASLLRAAAGAGWCI